MLVLTLDGVYHSIDLTKASVHVPQHLKDIKHNDLQDCLLLADKGYLSAQEQLDLLYSKDIEFHGHAKNQHGFRRWPTIFKTAR